MRTPKKNHILYAGAFLCLTMCMWMYHVHHRKTNRPYVTHVIVSLEQLSTDVRTANNKTTTINGLAPTKMTTTANGLTATKITTTANRLTATKITTTAKPVPLCPKLKWKLDQPTAMPKRGNIPPIVHYVYKTSVIPVQYIPLIHHCVQLNPDITFVLWTDADIEHLMKNHYNGSYYEKYRTYTYGIEKADVARIFIIHAFGGIYMDMDMACKRPLTVSLMNESCIIDQEQQIQTQIHWNRKYSAMNSAMACTQRHPFFERLINKLEKNDGRKYILDKAGPFFLTKHYEEYHQNSTNQNSSLSVTLADPGVFSPFVDKLGHLEGICRGNKGGWRAVGCKNVPVYKRDLKSLEDNAVLIHKWLHLGYNWAYGRIKKNVHLCGLGFNITRFS